MNLSQKTCLVSACLIGLCTRYDGQRKPDADCLRRLVDCHWIPVCPEQLGGLPTPRPAACLVGGDGHDVLAGTAQVVDRHGRDLSEEFIRGAQMVLTIARMQRITLCLLKSGSPSCGLDPLPGVTSALLLTHGIQVIPF
jgi:uncharacterized protein YbbK (DUF523 family)